VSTKRSEEAYARWIDATLKFDYFIAGVTLAATGYIATTLSDGIGTGRWFNFTSALLVSFSSFSALKRIEAALVVMMAGGRKLAEYEAKGALTQATASGTVLNVETGETFDPMRAAVLAISAGRKAEAHAADERKWADKARGWYHRRNASLILGLLIYMGSRALLG